jgi:hypothetical protein
MNTDCRTEEGITIGLIDSIIIISRILAKRKLNTPQIQEALKDLGSDEDLESILIQCKLALQIK